MALLILGAAIWIGGMAAVTILAVSSRRTLEPADRTRLFRDFGKRYFAVAGVALVVVFVSGGILLTSRPWDALSTAIVVALAVNLAVLAVGVGQARTMRRRREAAARTGEPVTGTRLAAALRGLLGVLAVAIFVLAICTAA
jgi:uncharacterized membrane protein